MKRTEANIPDIIGILMVIIALVSAGGLYYTASVYTDISDTSVSVESAITGAAVSYDEDAKTFDITVTVLVNNPSSLDIEVYRIEYTTYMDQDPSSIYNTNRYIGSGSSSQKNNTVKAESLREMQVSFQVTPDNPYHERILYAMGSGTNVYFLAEGIVWFNVAEYGRVQNQVDVFSMEYLEVRNV